MLNYSIDSTANMNSEHDDDLRELLDQLDDQEDVTEQVEQDHAQQTDAADPDVESVPETDDQAAPDANSQAPDPVESTEIDELEDVGEPREQVIRPVAADAPTRGPDDELSEGDSQSGIDIEKYHARLDQVTNEILTACRSDRQEAQDVIELLRHQIDDATGNDRAPQRMWVDGLVKAVEVKAGINATAVKIVEANAKMLAATKSNVNILNQNVSGGSQDLEDVLSCPLTESDEY